MVTWSLHRGRHPVPSEAEKLIIFVTVSTGEGVGLHQSVDSRMSRTDNQPTNQPTEVCSLWVQQFLHWIRFRSCLPLLIIFPLLLWHREQTSFFSLSGEENKNLHAGGGAQRKAQFSKVSWTTSWLNRC